MKRITAFILCAVLIFALSSVVSAESADLEPPRVFIYNGGDYMDICLDGIDENYLRRFSEIYDPDDYRLLYEIGFEFGADEKPQYGFRVKTDCYPDTPYVDGGVQRRVTEPGYTSDYEYDYWEGFDPYAEVSYYTENNGVLTSGYHFRICDRDAINYISGQTHILFIFIAAMESPEKWRDEVYKSWYTEEDKPYLKVTFTDRDYPFASASYDKGSPDTGASDIAVIIGLAVVAAAPLIAVSSH